MKYFIFDDKFYARSDSFLNGAGPEDINRGLFKEGSVCVSVVNYAPKVIVTSETNLKTKEEAILREFDDSFVVQDERIRSNTFQVVGVENELIKQIYAAFKELKVVSVIPYGLALRAYLNSMNLVPVNRVIVFIDNFGDKIFLTFINDKVYSKASRIIHNNKQETLTEIKRYVQNFSSQQKNEDNNDSPYFFVTNSKEIHNLLLTHNVVKPEDSAFINEAFPAIEGHSTAKFDTHFLLPEDLIRLRRLQHLKNRMKYAAGSLVCLGISLLVFFNGVIQKSLSSRKFNSLQVGLQRANEDLNIQNTKHYKDYFFKRIKPTSAFVIFEFINNIPEDQIIQNYSILRNNNGWKFEGIITAETKSSSLKNFNKNGIFKNALVEYIVLSDKPSQRIILYFN